MKKIIFIIIMTFSHSIITMEIDDVKTPKIKRKQVTFANSVKNTRNKKLIISQKKEWQNQNSENEWNEHLKKYCKFDKQSFDPTKYDDDRLVHFFCFASKDLDNIKKRIINQKATLAKLISEKSTNQFAIQFNSKMISNDNHEIHQLTAIISAINQYLEVDQSPVIQTKKKMKHKE